ncbi:hypothetical protein [Nocardia aurantia]|uniref:Uncharacterized protein n=1 Tax=Nocardia aurantia TaxID=2585199 RepID=A0A7K0DW27_9NOCA|nr:hypothetical protein [Nocardia aurantia]MQY29983.1 hypothetical protein [Nocardia aurantia]
MEPIEINAGSWYLRALRADDRVDDRPALAEGGVTEPGYVERRGREWAAETHLSWAVCVPTTAELVAEIGATPQPGGTVTISGWSRPGYENALDEGLAAVRRFVAGALGLQPA